MKNLFPVLLAFLVSFSALGQTELRGTKSALTETERNKLSESLTEYSLISLDTRGFKALLRRQKNQAKVRLLINPGLSWNMTLAENEIRAGKSKAEVHTAMGTIEEGPVSECHTYSGYLNDDPNQYVRLFVSEELIKGLIIDRDKGAFFIEPLSTFTKSGKDNRLVVYNLADTKTGQGICGNENLRTAVMGSVKKAQGSARVAVPTTCRILEVATDADGEYFNNHGNNVANTLNDILAIMNVVDGVYTNTFNVRIVVVFQNVYQDPATDPYTTTNSDAAITQFQNFWNANRTNVARDAATLFTGKFMTVVVGGTTFQVFGQVPQYATICRNLNSSYLFVADLQFNFYTATHELGHLFNAGHPNPNGTDCQPNRSVMCQGVNIANVFFANASQNEINNHINGGDGCLRDFSSVNINGPATLCSSSTYQALGGPVNSTGNWTWTTSPNISLNTTTGQTVTATPTGNGVGWIQITQTVGCPITFRLNVTVGSPQFNGFLVNGQPTQNAYFCAGSSQYIQAQPSSVDYNYNWYVSSGNVSNASLSPSGSTATFNSYVSGCYGISLQLSNACGTVQTGLTLCAQSCFARYTVYPNPATEYVTVEFDEIESAEALPDEIELLSEESTKPVREVDVQEAFSSRMLKNGNQIEINVKDLPRGTYYLHVKNSRRKEQEVDRIRILLE